jgi:hypothetical protein
VSEEALKARLTWSGSDAERQHFHSLVTIQDWSPLNQEHRTQILNLHITEYLLKNVGRIPESDIHHCEKKVGGFFFQMGLWNQATKAEPKEKVEEVVLNYLFKKYPNLRL